MATYIVPLIFLWMNTRDFSKDNLWSYDKSLICFINVLIGLCVFLWNNCFFVFIRLLNFFLLLLTLPICGFLFHSSYKYSFSLCDTGNLKPAPAHSGHTFHWDAKPHLSSRCSNFDSSCFLLILVTTANVYAFLCFFVVAWLLF